ncbi:MULTISPECIES: ABC transporter permease [Paraliobacillus]|uniref:ABC transporter permease n=1 Tax=Paraliobacillus TaxID=200903 RepID=UPI000DD3655E|nr:MULTISPECIES: ABC transporter permease [Paraliobacillus]
MSSLKRILFFIKHYQKQLQKKWKSIPLLLLFPILIVGLCFTIVVTLLLPSENKPIEVGLIDLDQSEETTMLVNVIDDSSLLGSYIHISKYTEEEADHAIEQGTISTYIMFPENFTDDLYNGNSVGVSIIGNPDMPIDSYMIKELIDSMTRYIASAQANILTIDKYAKQLPIDNQKRQEILMEQFNQFLLFTVSNDKVVYEKEITNLTTTSPIEFFSLSGWFVIFTIWIIAIYIVLGKDESLSLWNRMRLYGVTMLQRLISRLILSLFYGFILAIGGFYLFIQVMDIEFYLIDYARIGMLVSFFCTLFLVGLSFIDLLIKSKKLALIIQLFYTSSVLFMSGSILPTLYFPEDVKYYLPYLFSAETFYWLTEIAIKGRMYVDYTLLFLLVVISVATLIALAMWKERRHR